MHNEKLFKEINMLVKTNKKLIKFLQGLQQPKDVIRAYSFEPDGNGDTERVGDIVGSAKVADIISVADKIISSQTESPKSRLSWLLWPWI